MTLRRRRRRRLRRDDIEIEERRGADEAWASERSDCGEVVAPLAVPPPSRVYSVTRSFESLVGDGY